MLTQAFSDFITNTDFENIPEKAKLTAKKSILDMLGVAVAGSEEEPGKIITGFVKETGGVKESGVIASGLKTSAYSAALANGTLGHAMDYDDDNEMSHPTVAILPVALALGEKLKASGKDVMAAYIIGWDVETRICEAIASKAQGAGWHGTGAIAVMGSIAAAAKMLKLNTSQVKFAFGIGASEASGLRLNFGTDTKPLHAGLSASNGVRAAQLAIRGFTASDSILEGPIGYCKLLSGEDYDPKILNGLGSNFKISDTACLKMYPACYAVQRSLDSILKIVKDHDVRPEDVKEIDCTVHLMVSESMPYVQPSTVTEARFSFPYCMAVAVIDRAATLKQFTLEKIRDKSIAEMIKKVKIITLAGKKFNPYSLHESGEAITISLKNGKEYSQVSGTNRGHILNPMTWEEVADKFKTCVEGKLTKKNADKCISLVENFESIPDINELMTILCKTKSEG